MWSKRRDKPEVKASKAGSLYVEVSDVIESKSGRQTIRNMSKLSKKQSRAKSASSEERDD